MSITAHVNDQGIVLRYRYEDNLPSEDWEVLLDDLKSHFVPSLYPTGRRCIVDPWVEGNGTRMTIYFTSGMVTFDEAVSILKRWNFSVNDVRESPTD